VGQHAADVFDVDESGRKYELANAQGRLLPLLIAVFLVGSCSKKTPSLNLLVWEGYADPSFVKAFEDENQCKISASYMGSSDELRRQAARRKFRQL